MAKVELSQKWWEKNAPDSIAKEEVHDVLSEVEENQPDFEATGSKSDNPQTYLKALEKLKASAAKDEQTAKKAKDSEAIAMLAGLKKAADEEREKLNKYLKAGKGTMKGLGGASGVQVPIPKNTVMASAGGSSATPMGGGATVVDTIVNTLDKAWTIVKDNKPDSSAKSSFCQAVPGNIPWQKLHDWKDASVSWTYDFVNGFGIKTVDVKFQLDYQWNGQTDEAAGLFLNNYNVWCSTVDVLWGFTLNVDATVSGNPFNSGSKDAPVGAIPLLISAQIKNLLLSETPSWKITCHGNGRRDVA